MKITTRNIHLFGFYLGDGTKKNNRTIAITNSETSVIEEMIKLFNFLGLKRSQLKASITLKTNSFIDSKFHWSKITKIPVKNFQKTNWRKGKSKNIFGSIKIEYYNAETKRLFDNLIETSKKEALRNKMKGFEFLRGVAAADGSMGKRNGKLHKVIFCVFGDEREYLKKLLSFLDLHFFEEEIGLSIGNISDMLTLKKHDIFLYHKKRRAKFLQLGEALHTLPVKPTEHGLDEAWFFDQVESKLSKVG